MRSLVTAFLATLLLSLAPATMPASATTAIQRCTFADGSVVYTDTACGSLGATRVALPGPLLTRIAREEARFADDGDADAVPPGALPPVPRRSAASGCARSPTQLAMDLRGALALGDVNRVAESYDWIGMSSRQGERTLDRLQQLIGKPVVDSHYFDAQIGPADAGEQVASTSTVGGDAGVLQLVLGSGGSQSAIDFDVHKAMGCYFVRF
jgi:hypothetical protein